MLLMKSLKRWYGVNAQRKGRISIQSHLNRKKFQTAVYTALMEKYFLFRLLDLTKYIYDKLHMFQILFCNDEHFMHPWFLLSL